MRAFLFAVVFAIVGPVAAASQTMNHDHMMHGSQAGIMSEATLPRETGQSAFAAIQEIVALLEADPTTDWSKVDIEALRQHLIDMNNVTLEAVVEATRSGDSMQFVVLGEGLVRESIRRMVTAHATTMNGVDGWKLEVKNADAGAILTVTPPDQVSMIKLQALGFIGFMTLGMHHQQHHWMLANGKAPHP